MARKNRPRGLNRAALAPAVWERHGGLTLAESSSAVEAMLQSLKEALSEKGRVTLRNFGTFAVVERRDRRGTSPSTGQAIRIPSRRGVRFRPARDLTRVLSQDSG